MCSQPTSDFLFRMLIATGFLQALRYRHECIEGLGITCLGFAMFAIQPSKQDAAQASEACWTQCQASVWLQRPGAPRALSAPRCLAGAIAVARHLGNACCAGQAGAVSRTWAGQLGGCPNGIDREGAEEAM